MKKYLFILLLISLFTTELSAQRRNGLIARRIDSDGVLSFSVGPAYLYGDPFGNVYDKSFLNGTNFSTSLSFRQMFVGNFGYRASLIYGNYVGSDLATREHTVGYLSFNSSILELTMRGEYKLFSFGGNRFSRDTPNSIYLFLGGGLASTNVTNPPGSAPLDVAQTTALVMPLGFYYEYALTPNFMIGAEFGWQLGFSDYLDGYHPPVPNSKSDDVLGNFHITVSYRIF